MGSQAGLEGSAVGAEPPSDGLGMQCSEANRTSAPSGWASVSSDQFIILRRGFQEEEMAQTKTSWGAAVVDEWAWAQMRGGRQGACKGRSKVIVMLQWAMGPSWG